MSSNVIPAILKVDDAAAVKICKIGLVLFDPSMITVWSPPPGVVRLPAPKIDKDVLPLGTVNVVSLPQVLPPLHAGMLMTVVEEVAAVKQA